MRIAATSERVHRHTPRDINEEMRRDIECRVRYYSEQLDHIERRLRELHREWDIERVLELNAGVISLVTLTLGLFSKKWRPIPFIVAFFLAQHAVQGWCPPVSLFRRMGVRTEKEINRERFALKAMRGDFEDVSGGGDPAMRAAKALEATDYQF